jgi:hypothetical protein
MPVSRRLLANAIATRLLTVTNATGYYGQVGRLLPGAPSHTPLDPPAKSDDDPRVQPYFVLYPGAGAPSDEQDLALSGQDLTTTLQVTVAGGDVEDVLALVDRVDAALLRWSPAVEGAVCGFLWPPTGYQPPLLPDRTVTPHRQFVPLQYQLTANTT